MSGLEMLALAGAWLLWGLVGLLGLGVLLAVVIVFGGIAAFLAEEVRKHRRRKRYLAARARNEAIRLHPAGRRIP